MDPILEQWEYNLKAWFENPHVDESLKNKADLPIDPNLLRDHFSKFLTFGTAGLRAEIGIGLNRMNIFTVAVTTQAIASSLRDAYASRVLKNRGIIIGYDTRHHSETFAKAAACVFAANGILSYLFDQSCPTPVLAYATKKTKSVLGVMITASHNPSQYNGYKVYGDEGIQISDAYAAKISSKIALSFNSIDLEKGFAENLIAWAPKEIGESYIKDILNLIKPTAVQDIPIAYTPIHGTGTRFFVPLLNEAGFTVHPLASQVTEDPDFSTVSYPNPEIPETMALVKDWAQEIRAELVLATDPDADRLAVMVPNDTGQYVLLTGNQVGALMTYYWINFLKKTDSLPEYPTLVKSIVTDNFGADIAISEGIQVVESLTGFKSICGKIREFKKNKKNNYILGYEESIGYAVGDVVLDKDGISAGLIMALAASDCKTKGKTLWTLLQELEHKHGYYISEGISIPFAGPDGQKNMKKITNAYRFSYPTKINGINLDYSEDFLIPQRSKTRTDGSTRIIESESIESETSNVLRFIFEDKCWYALRPSGTEPKLKIYICAVGKNKEKAIKQADEIKKTIFDFIKKYEENDQDTASYL